jgi:ribosome biogenesis GTPase / thiamine phosphate phosphatase
VTSDLEAMGWSTTRAADVPSGSSFVPARIIGQDRSGWTVRSEHGDLLADLRGKLRKLEPSERPSVGDWVLVSPRLDESKASIEAVLPRTSALVRNAAGNTTHGQVVAANVDTVFITVPGDARANPRRLERQLAMVFESGATPVVVATKSDLGSDVSWIDDVVIGTAVVNIDSLRGDGVDALDQWLVPGSTVVVVGPSGAGKSTLANRLLGDEILATGAVRSSDGRGRHTTTRRELVVLPSGALLIDTPGVRELALGDASEGIAATFSDIDALIDECRFSDCSHGGEPGCAIVNALTNGTLAPDRWASWQKLQAELEVHRVRTEERARQEDRRKVGKVSAGARKRSRS